MYIKDSLFIDDISVMNLINIIEKGDNEYIIATEIEGGCMPAKFSFQNDKSFSLDFNMPNNIFEKTNNDFFFTHHLMLLTKGLKLLIQNKDINSFEHQIGSKDTTVNAKLVVNSFRADIDDKLWMNSKQAAYCFFNKDDFNANNFGIQFDMTTNKDQNYSWKNCLKIEVDNSMFLLYFYICEDKRNLFVLKSQKEIDHDKFLEVLESVKVALGLLSGYYIADYTWYVAMNRKDNKSLTFRYENINKSIYNKYPILDSCLYKDIEKAERMLSSFQFEKLVILFYKHKEIRNSSLVLIQAGCLNGISRGCLAAVSLETIKTKIIESNTKQDELITDTTVKSKLKHELTKGLHTIKGLVEPIIYKRLESKIGQINQVSNAEKLEAPFEFMNIKLSEDEMYCLSYRNNFLHGSSISPKGNFYKCLNQNELIDIVSFRLIMLTAMLILKKCGYNGNVVDWGYTLISKMRAIHVMKSIMGSGNAFRSLDNRDNTVLE